MTYAEVCRVLKSLGLPCAQVAWDSPPEKDYIVTRIGGQERDLWSDNVMTEQELYCTVDLFVHNSEGAELAQRIQQTLNSLGIRWELTSIQWESENRINHWEWTFYTKGML